MWFLKRGWVFVLVVFLGACGLGGGEEATPAGAGEVETRGATAEVLAPSDSPAPTRTSRVTTTPTLRATSGAPAAEEEEAVEPGTTQLRVLIDEAYLRSGPGQNYPVIDTAARGSRITVLGYATNGAWFNVRLGNGRTGWIGATITERVGDWSLDEVSEAATVPAPPPTPQNNCDPAYPTVCIPSPPPDLDCRDIAYESFTVLPPDPHLFDGNGNGLGCEPPPEGTE